MESMHIGVVITLMRWPEDNLESGSFALFFYLGKRIEDDGQRIVLELLRGFDRKYGIVGKLGHRANRGALAVEDIIVIRRFFYPGIRKEREDLLLKKILLHVGHRNI